jgi:hypothetical protein
MEQSRELIDSKSRAIPSSLSGIQSKEIGAVSFIPEKDLNSADAARLRAASFHSAAN